MNRSPVRTSVSCVVTKAARLAVVEGAGAVEARAPPGVAAAAGATVGALLPGRAEVAAPPQEVATTATVRARIAARRSRRRPSVGICMHPEATCGG